MLFKTVEKIFPAVSVIIEFSALRNTLFTVICNSNDQTIQLACDFDLTS